MTRELLDKDGENLAVRTFLQLYGATSSVTTGDMCRHLSATGFDGFWPEWVADAHDRTHLTKGGAQDWLRFLFALEPDKREPIGYLDRFNVFYEQPHRDLRMRPIFDRPESQPAQEQENQSAYQRGYMDGMAKGMRDAAEDRAEAAQPATPEQGRQPDITEMVSRFLAWPLPKTFAPDCGISFKPLGHPNSWPVGTHLLTADEAMAMFQHCLQPATSADDLPPPEWLQLTYEVINQMSLMGKPCGGYGEWARRQATGDATRYPDPVAALARLAHQYSSAPVAAQPAAPEQQDRQADIKMQEARVALARLFNAVETYKEACESSYGDPDNTWNKVVEALHPSWQWLIKDAHEASLRQNRIDAAMKENSND
jgi:hypothetical protein